MAADDRRVFDEIFNFLHEFDWIHNFQVTKFFVEKIWTRIPQEWHDHLLNLSLEELNSLPYQCGKGETTFPDSMKRFIQISNKLSLQRTPISRSCANTVNSFLSRGMTPKKQHEVTNMSAVVMETASKSGCDVVVDIGSGLGYLGQVLHKTYGYPVIGVEGCVGHTEKAEKRSVKQDLEEKCVQNVTFNLEDTSKHLSMFEEKISQTIRDIQQCQHSQRRHSCNQIQSRDHQTSSSDQIQSHDYQNMSCDQFHSYDHKLCGELQHGPSNSETQNQFQTSSVTECEDENRFHVKCPDTTDTKSCNYSMFRTLNEKHHKTGTAGHSLSNNCDKYDGKCADEAGKSLCMIGLHCCGDLTPTMLHYFLSMLKVRSLCLVSCCYHKMVYDTEKSTFHSFPLSCHCQTSYSEIQRQHPDWHLHPVSFRLAAQETRSRWRNQSLSDHDIHTRRVAYRALLEIFFQEAGLDPQSLDRKIVRKADFSSFNSFTASFIRGLNVCSDVGEQYRQLLQDIHDRYRQYFSYIEVITVLQVLVQPVLENLLQQDRQMFLTQHGVEAKLVPIFDENISPRNIALIANKTCDTYFLLSLIIKLKFRI